MKRQRSLLGDLWGGGLPTSRKDEEVMKISTAGDVGAKIGVSYAQVVSSSSNEGSPRRKTGATTRMERKGMWVLNGPALPEKVHAGDALGRPIQRRSAGTRSCV